MMAVWMQQCVTRVCGCYAKSCRDKTTNTPDITSATKPTKINDRQGSHCTWLTKSVKAEATIGHMSVCGRHRRILNAEGTEKFV